MSTPIAAIPFRVTNENRAELVRFLEESDDCERVDIAPAGRNVTHSIVRAYPRPGLDWSVRNLPKLGAPHLGAELIAA